MPELLLVEVLRLHLASAPAANHGWLAALRDPILAPALEQLHQAPERKWTVADLAAAASVSRSVLDERFRSALGRSPTRYLTEWRMHAAKELLAATTLTVGTIARRVGYDSDEAFSRAFRRAFGRPPGAVAGQRSTGLNGPPAGRGRCSSADLCSMRASTSACARWEPRRLAG